MGTANSGRALAVGIMMMFFATLALDIAVPATVLSLMALLKWLVPSGFSWMEPRGEAA